MYLRFARICVRLLLMKKLSVVIAIILLAGCGSAQPKTQETENPKVEVKESKYYPITVIKPEKGVDQYGAMLNIPDGFMLDRDHFDKTGEFIFMYSDKIASFTVMFKPVPGANDASNYLDMEMVKPNQGAFAFGKMEESGVWTTPMPGSENYESCDATHARISYDRMIETAKVTGTFYVWWFYDRGQGRMAGRSFAIIITQECKKDDWNKMAPLFDIMRKTLCRLPSRGEVTAISMFEKKDEEFRKIGLGSLNDRLLQMYNGQGFAPMWDTLIGKYIYALDIDRYKLYLVPSQKTPSGLLPNPEIEGWTIDPMLGDWVTDYLELPEQAKPKLTPYKKPNP
jgi:hypothetical protein